MQPVWRKSSFSQDGGECVELAWSAGQAFARDSKNPSGPQIPVDLPALVDTVKAGSWVAPTGEEGRVSLPAAGRRRRPIEPIDAGGDDTTSVVAAARR
jgi:hypothetical protein